MLGVVCVKLKPIIFIDGSGNCKAKYNTTRLSLTRAHILATAANINPSRQKKGHPCFERKQGIFRIYS